MKSSCIPLNPQAPHVRHPIKSSCIGGRSGSLSLVVSCLVLFPIPQEVLSQGSLGGCLEAYSWWSPLWGVWEPIPGGLLFSPLHYSSGIPFEPQAYHYILRHTTNASGSTLSPQAAL